MNDGNWHAVATKWQDAGASWLKAFANQATHPSEPAQRYWETIGQSWSKWVDQSQHRAAPRFDRPHAPPADRRFAGPEWQTPYFALLRDQYLALCKYWEDAAAATELPPRDKERLRFAVKQWLDAIAPANFPWRL